MQDAAFRFAAQALQNSGSEPISDASLRAVVDEHLGGAGRTWGDVSTGNLTAYMMFKAFSSQWHQRDAMFDVTVLAPHAFMTGSIGNPSVQWLAHTLVGLQQDADRLAATTPVFSAEITTQVRRVVKHAELDGLTRAMRTAAAQAATVTDDEHAHVEAHYSTFNC
jgi:hypothetical protein